MPAVPGVVVTVMVAFAEPPAVSVTVGEDGVQVPAAVPVAPVVAQVMLTVPAKPLVEVTVTTLVLPVVAPEMSVSVDGAAVAVRPAAFTVTFTGVEVVVMDPLTPVTVTESEPLVPAVVLMVRVELLVEPAVSVTALGDRMQLPAAVPLVLVTAQVSATVPAKVPVEVTAIDDVLPVVAPEISVSAVGVGVMVNPLVEVTVRFSAAPCRRPGSTNCTWCHRSRRR